MKLLPFDKTDFKINLTTTEVENILKNNTHEVGFWGFFAIYSRTNKLLEGEVGSGKFIVKRHIKYRNSFLPIMIGEYMHDDIGTRVSIRFRLYAAVLALSIVFISLGILLTSIGAFLSVNDADSNSLVLVGAGLTLVFYSLMAIGFNIELKRSKQVINELFKVASR